MAPNAIIIAASLILSIVKGTEASSSTTPRLIRTDREAIQMRLQLIERAQTEVWVTSCFFDDESVTHLFLDHLRRATERGVHVRILLDASSTTFPKIELKKFLSERFEVGFHRSPNALNLPYVKDLYPKMHDKIWLFDNEALLIGGRNINNKNFGFPGPVRQLNDEVFAAGPVGQTVRKYLSELWMSKWVDRMQKELEAPDSPLIRSQSAIDSSTLSFFATEFDRPSPNSTPTQIVLDQIHRAKERIQIVTPYIVLTDDFKRAFQSAISRGVEVTLFTNSWPTATFSLIQARYESQKEELLSMGLNIYELIPQKAPLLKIHGKSYVFDDQTLLIGSFNLDRRSQMIDREVILLVDDPYLAKEMKEFTRQRYSSLVRTVTSSTFHLNLAILQPFAALISPWL